MPEPAELSQIAALQLRLQVALGNHAQLVEAFDHLESGVVLYGADDRIVFCNRRFREIYNEVADLLVPGTPYAEIARSFYRRGLEHRTQMDEAAYVQLRVEKHLDPDEGDYEWLLGDDIWLLVSDRKTFDGGVIGFRLDITARKRAEAKLAESEQRLRSLLDMSSDWYWEQDEHFRFTHISGGLARSTGVDRLERYGRTRWEIACLGISEEALRAHQTQVEARLPFRDFQYGYADFQGKTRWVSASGDPIFDADGKFIGYRGVGSDITEKKRAEARINQLAEYDFLTELPNRMLLASRFEFARRQAERSGVGMSLLFIDLDRFKNINDSLGHHVGDEILIQTAKRLKEAMRVTDTVARHGGDEFIVLLPGVSDFKSLATLTDALVRSLARPHVIGPNELTVTPSIGIAVWPMDGADLPTLIKNADLAMYHSKSEGRNQFSFFRAEMNERVVERLTIENALRRALQNDELSLVYQPIFNIPGQRIIGAEALLRWHSGALGSVQPERFIAAAEETGLITGIGEWAVSEALSQLRKWRDAGLDHFPVTLNVSTVQLKTRHFQEFLQRAICAHALTPDDVEIELAETALGSESDAVIATIEALGAAGFRLVIGDFGVGYSKLGYLRRFKIGKIKIDQSFVRDMATEPDAAAIIRGMISLAKNLGIRVVAEGVEHAAQLEMLLAAECTEAQGFLLSMPLAGSQLQEKY